MIAFLLLPPVTKAIAIFLSCTSFLSLLAQEIELKQFSVGSNEMSYARYLDHSEPTALLLSFFPADSLAADQYMQQYYPLADKQGWLALAFPFAEIKNAKHWQAVQKVIQAELSIKDGDWKVYNLVDQSPWITSWPEKAGEPHLDGHILNVLKHPLGKGSFVVLDNLPIAVIGDHQKLDSLIDSIAYAGAWLKEFKSSVPESTRSLTSVLPQLDKAIVWMDSLTSQIRDSTILAGFEGKIGIANKLPEIVKEGRKVRVEVFVPYAADCRFELTDLSGDAAWTQRGFRGRGMSSFDIPTRGLNWGVYQLEVEVGIHIQRHKIIIRG